MRLNKSTWKSRVSFFVSAQVAIYPIYMDDKSGSFSICFQHIER